MKNFWKIILLIFIFVIILFILGSFNFFKKKTLKTTPPVLPTQLPFNILVGDQELVMKNGTFGMKDFPDGTIGTLKIGDFYHWWFGAFAGDSTKTFTVRLKGQAFEDMRADPSNGEGSYVVPVLNPGPAGSPDSGGAVISSVYYHKTGKLYAWYQIQDYEVPEGVVKEECYCSIGAAVSDDLGQTFKKLGQVVRQIMTKADFIRRADVKSVDTGTATVIASGDFLYMYYWDWDHQKDIAGIAIARLQFSDLDKSPQPWKKLYRGSFSETGLGGSFTPITNQGGFPTVSINTHVKHWLMINHIPDDLGSGFALKYSPDGIKWFDHNILFKSTDKNILYFHPTIISQDATHQSGREFWLYYLYTTDGRKKDIWMARRKIILNL